MIKLSRTGWNNVIIFAVMGFILLINMTQNNSLKDTGLAQEEIKLIEEHAVILSLTVNQQTNIERIGQTWRAIPTVIKGQQLEAMMSSWHDVAGQLITKPDNIDKSKSVVVSLVLAGSDKDDYYMLMPNKKELIIFKQSTEQWLMLAAPVFSQLVPNEVIM